MTDVCTVLEYFWRTFGISLLFSLGWIPSWRMFGIPLLFSLVWICNPAQLSNRICNSHNNVT